MKGEVFGFVAMVLGAGALIAFLDWIAKNYGEALDEKAPGCESHGPGEGPSGNRAPTHTHPDSHPGSGAPL